MRATNLFRETFRFFLWTWVVVAKFRRVDALDTWMVVFSSIGKKLTSLIAFFLPLKVILLLGSDGVPRYFRSFISPDTRDDWIIFLACASVVLYISSLLFGLSERKRSNAGSSKVLQLASEMAIVRNQVDIAETYYSQFCTILASIIFSLVLLVASIWLFPGFGIFMLALILAEWVIFSALLGNFDAKNPTRIALFLRRNIRSFLAVLASVNFLLVFGFLLVVFLFYGGVNILIAILAILISRQLFSNLAGVAGTATNLLGEERKVNALVFREHQFARIDAPEVQHFRRLYSVDMRLNRIGQILDVEPVKISSILSDVGPPGITVFDIIHRRKNASPDHYCELVFSPGKSHFVDNENVLFQYMGTEELRCSVLIEQYELENFIGRIYACDRTKGPTVHEWKTVRRQMLAHLWSTTPSRQLVDVYCMSKPLLHQRLTPDQLGRFELALESKVDRQRYERFMMELNGILSIVSDVPLFVFNPKLSRSMTVLGPDGRYELLNWGAWTLAPIGAGIGSAKSDQAWLNDLHSSGELGNLPLSSIVISSLLWELEDRLSKGELVASKSIVARMLSVLDENCDRT